MRCDSHRIFPLDMQIQTSLLLKWGKWRFNVMFYSKPNVTPTLKEKLEREMHFSVTQ